MQRVRRAADVALALVVGLCLSSLPAAAIPLGRGVALAATVAWPVSTLVVSEVQTGGSNASDEFVEIANQGAGPVDLIGLEVVYATSSGSTVTRKATWSASTILSPGRRILVVNGAGSYVGLGDATYTGGFARDRWGDRASGRRRVRDRCSRLGRCDQRLRGGIADRRATCVIERGAAPWRRSRQRDRHERQRDGLVHLGHAGCAEPRLAGRARRHADTDADAQRHGDTESDAGCDTDSGSHSGSHVGSDCDAYADRRTDAHSDGDPRADADDGTDPRADRDTDTHTGTDGRPLALALPDACADRLAPAVDHPDR